MVTIFKKSNLKLTSKNFLKDFIIILLSVVFIISIRFLFSDNAFREYFYIDEYLEDSQIVNTLGLSDNLFFKIDPYGTTDEYLKEKNQRAPKKNTIVYFIFVFLTVFRVVLISFAIYYFCLFLGYIIFLFFDDFMFIESITGAARSIPSIAWIPLLSSLGLLLEIQGIFLFLFLGVFPLILSQVLLGIKNCPKELLNTVKLYNVSTFQAYWRMLIKAQERIFLQGLGYGLSLGLILMLVYEIFFESTPGIIRIVQPLSMGYELKDSLLMLILIGLIGILLDRIPKIMLDMRYIIRSKRAKSIKKYLNLISNECQTVSLF